MALNEKLSVTMQPVGTMNVLTTCLGTLFVPSNPVVEKTLKSTNINFKVDEKSKGYTAGDHECLYQTLC